MKRCIASNLINLAAIPILLTGCAKSDLVFGTATVIGSEASAGEGEAVKVTVGYDRSEVALIPPKANGQTHSVYGGVDYDFSWADHTLILSQTIATGKAAELASGNSVETPPSDASANQDRRLFFTTATRAGLSLNLSTTTPGFLFGYKRAEFTLIPVASNTAEVNPVYADISLVADKDGNVRAKPKDDNTSTFAPRDPIPSDRLPGSKDGIRIVQRFATGQAALNVAGTNTKVRAKLAAAAGAAGARTIGILTETQTLEDGLKKITDPAAQNALLDDLAAENAFPVEKPDWEQLPGMLPNLLQSDKGPKIREILTKHINLAK